MKRNYPIKYAVMPMVEQVGWNTGIYGLEREYGIVCNIVSKCYLVGEKTTFEENGSKKTNYQVVFPYEAREFNKWKRVVPEKNSTLGYYSNSTTVDKVFDSYEKAADYCDKKNDKLRDTLTMYLPYSDDYFEKLENKLKDFDIKFANYKLLEQIFLDNTYDMKIGNGKKLKNIVKVIDKNKGHILNTDLYKIIDLLDTNNYIVYSIKEKEYEDLIDLINRGEEFDILSFIKKSTPLLAHSNTNSSIRIIDDSIEGYSYIEQGKIFYNNEEMEDFSIDKFDKDTIIILTTEKLKDILKSYEEHKDIEFIYIDNEEELKKASVKNIKNKR